MDQGNPNAIIGGTTRHYTGRGLGGETIAGKQGSASPVEWTCPNCRAKNLSVQANGCTVCGAGTSHEADVAAVVGKPAKFGPEEVARQVIGVVGATERDLEIWAGILSAPARLSLARALAHYAETGQQTKDELVRSLILSWARAIMPRDETTAPSEMSREK